MRLTILLIAAACASSSAWAAEISTTAVAAAHQRLTERCRNPVFGVDEVLADPALRKDLEILPAEEAQDLLHYSACRSLQSGTDACAALDKLGHGFGGGVAGCRALVAHDRFVFAVLRGGDADGACRRMFEEDGVKGPSAEKGCAAVIPAIRAGTAAAACGVLKQEKLVGPEESCEDMLSSWTGSPRACEKIKDAGSRKVCASRASLAAGLRDASRCAASASCLALTTKSPASCDALRVRYARALCGRVAAVVADEQKRAAKERDRRSETENAVRLKAAKSAEAQAAAAAAVQAKADAAAKREAEAREKMIKADRPQFRKGEPMQQISPEVKAYMKALEEGKPLPPKPKELDKNDKKNSGR